MEKRKIFVEIIGLDEQHTRINLDIHNEKNWDELLKAARINYYKAVGIRNEQQKLYYAKIMYYMFVEFCENK